MNGFVINRGGDDTRGHDDLFSSLGFAAGDARQDDSRNGTEIPRQDSPNNIAGLFATYHANNVFRCSAREPLLPSIKPVAKWSQSYQHADNKRGADCGVKTVPHSSESADRSATPQAGRGCQSADIDSFLQNDSTAEEPYPH